ncbi:UPF0147 family protein [Clostridium botulinum]|uniref:UPF0147 family protein n=1 Tax=Clostridium botulinum TaxID=1491 RepID=UPI0004D3A91B|nr:UPF0147 family protein [Clostridium botulinum]KEI01574.1 hypothetical protein Z952_12025 [Clostridium botulinum C/D str. BKT75002]KEI07908.1 hypothetical protein Z954_03160 [Clostridium botulinum C/D str. BKT2873]QPW61567.1 UPF0147 family protein [Clostridium botulinum]
MDPNNKYNEKSLTCKVSIKDTDIFKDILNIIKDITEDKRIPRPVRKEYKQKIMPLVKKDKSYK